MTMEDWYVDADFAVHLDIKIHNGGVLTMGKVVIQNNLMKQNLNTKSSTEVELVSPNDVLSKHLWTINFLNQ